MNAGSNTKVTKSKSVHYAFSATNYALFLSDYLKSNEGECMSQDEAKWLLHISDYTEEWKRKREKERERERDIHVGWR